MQDAVYTRVYRNGGIMCLVCREPLTVRLARGRKSGKPFVMLICSKDGRHFRAFITDKEYVKKVLEGAEDLAEKIDQAGRLAEVTRIAMYVRVSTSDGVQDSETQLMPLRNFCAAQEWEVFDIYIDVAPANDIAHRIRWRKLLDDAAKRRFSMVVVFKLDRAFRSVKHMHDTLAAWEIVGVGFKSYREQFDTSTALGRLLLNLLASLAEFELELIRER